MKRFFGVYFLLLTVSSLGQTTETLSWYKCMKGTIGKFPVVLHLHKWGHNYSGYYYYESTQEPIQFTGTDTSKNGLVLTGYVRGEKDEPETLKGKWNGTSYEGTWFKTGKYNPLSFK